MSYTSSFYHPKNHPSPSLSVCQCGWQASGGGHSYGPAVRDHYVIHYVIGGSGSYFVRGEAYPVSAGQGFLILPGDSTSYRADKQSPWEYYWVGFQGSEARQLLSLAGLGRERLLFSYTKDDRLRQHLSDLYFSSKEYASREYAMIGYLYLFFSCLITQQSDWADKKPAQRYLDQAVHYIRENSAYKLTVEDVARHVGIERSYLYRIFMEQLGSSVSDYLLQVKTQRAQELLTASQLSVTEIALSLGFQSLSHFSRAFKRQIGCSPAAYRRREAGEDPPSGS